VLRSGRSTGGIRPETVAKETDLISRKI